MALPQDGQDANGLTKVTQIPAGKELMFIDPTTNEGGIITLEDLTKQILNGLASQAFALDAGQMTLLAALNKLNSESKSFVSLKESIKYSGDDSAFNIVSSDSTIYYRAVALNVAHPVLLGSGGILIGYCFNRNYQRQIYYSSQIIATRTCYGGTWNSWERIK